MSYSRSEQFYIPASRHWIPDPHFSSAAERFEARSLRLRSWEWGKGEKDLFEEDGEGRVVKKTVGG